MCSASGPLRGAVGGPCMLRNTGSACSAGLAVAGAVRSHCNTVLGWWSEGEATETHSEGGGLHFSNQVTGRLHRLIRRTDRRGTWAKWNLQRNGSVREARRAVVRGLN